jgi:hypothetical protein
MDEAQGSAGQSQVPARTEKHLARSLEDLSHLFLSQVPAAAPSNSEAQNHSRRDAQSLPADSVTPTGSPPSSQTNHDQLVSLLFNSAGSLEEGLRAIDSNIPWEIGGAVDLVAVDRSNRLAIIDIDASASDSLLLRGICHVDWFARNVPIVRRMYPACALDVGSEPRLFLIAPHFSPVFRCAAHRITCLRITCVTYNVVTMPNGTGIFFQHA